MLLQLTAEPVDLDLKVLSDGHSSTVDRCQAVF